MIQQMVAYSGTAALDGVGLKNIETDNGKDNPQGEVWAVYSGKGIHSEMYHFFQSPCEQLIDWLSKA